MIRTSAALLLCLSLLAAHAGPVAAQTWVRTYGGPEDDYLSGLQETPDGGFLVVGSTRSFGEGEFDMWLLRLDPDGDVLWERTFGGASYDFGTGSISDPAGGFLVAGATDSFGGAPRDFWLIRLDEDGDTIWQRTYGTSSHDTADTILPVPGGGFLLVGGTMAVGNGDLWVVKLDQDLNPESGASHGKSGTDLEMLLGVAPTPDGGAVLVGTAVFPNPGGGGLNYDMLVLRVDSQGRKVWHHRFGGPGEDHGRAVAVASDGYLVAGSTVSFSPDGMSLWLLKLDFDGNLLWQRTLGTGTAGYFLGPGPGGGFLVGGSILAPGGTDLDVWIVHIDGQGRMLWQVRVGGLLDDNAFQFLEVSGGGYLVGGHTQSFGSGKQDILLMRLPPDAGPGSCCLVEATGEDSEDSSAGVEIVHDPDVPLAAQRTDVSPVAGVPEADVTSLCDGPGWVAAPGPVSHIPLGEPPLLVIPRRGRLRLESDAAALAYNVYADALGSWYAPRDRKGSVCAVKDWTDNGDGTLDLDYEIPPNSWILVTGSNVCGEGPAGPDSAGTERTQMGTWIRCGSGP